MLATAALVIYVGALAAAAASDLVSYQIPNSVCVVLVAGFALAALDPALPGSVILAHLSCGLALLALTALCFAFRLMGGGDAKLLAATALWVGWREVLPFVLLTAIAGGVLGLVLLTLRRFAPGAAGSGRWWGRLLARGEGVPYGIAIAVSGLLVLARTGPALLR
jgi:prepilin peptidase CpaA